MRFESADEPVDEIDEIDDEIEVPVFQSRTRAQTRQLAAGLATAMLAGPWTAFDIRARCAEALATPQPATWVTVLVEQVLQSYVHPPLDRPRELAALLPLLPAWEAGRLGPLRPHIELWRPVPTTQISRPWPVVPLDDVGALARLLDVTSGELAWFADVRGLERQADRPLRHYRVEWRAKPGGVRVLEVPKPRLREIQRRLLRLVIGPIPVHPAARGCVVGGSVRQAVAPHAGNGVVVRADLEAFFASISAARIYGVLRTAGYPEAVAHTITGLGTTVISQPSWRTVPVGTDGAAHRRLGRRLAVPHLPQGAPTSPALANLVAFALDRRLSALAESYDAVYTRYVDDLIFSGPRLPGRHLLRAVSDIAIEEGFELAGRKSVVLGRRGRQQVLGAVVNTRVSAPRPEIDRLRAILHNCARQGWRTQTRGIEPEAFRAQLYGRIAWVNGLDPRRGAQLRAAADRVDR